MSQISLFDNKNYIKPRPVLKWAGGKTQMLDILKSKIPEKYNRYIEPFIGGGALFFELEPSNAVISDSNPEIIHLYKTIAKSVEKLIIRLKEMKNEEEYYYKIRALDPDSLSDVDKAARTLYLNRTCYNGLYRVNKKGYFNVPFGKYKNPKICDEDNLRAVSELFKKTIIIHADYQEVLKEYAEPGDFIFLDPPYIPISKHSDFKRYTKEQFKESDHIELAQEVKRLRDIGCNVILTNSNHPKVHELYAEFKISIHKTKRNINSKATKRTGEDVVVEVKPYKRNISFTPKEISNQAKKFPPTRFMGSKNKLLEHIWGISSQFEFESVLDLFSGSGVVSYMFKSHNKQVFSNDYMSFSSNITKSLIENNFITLSEQDLEILFKKETKNNNFVSETFKDLYFNDEDNLFIDLIRSNIKLLDSEMKKSLALTALTRACLKKRPRGIFTYTGHRYDDGRKDINLSLKEQFLNAVKVINSAVFSNDKQNLSFNEDSLLLDTRADLVYIDPPYYSPLSDNEYVRRYHFLEGLVKDWENVEMQWHTKTKKFKSYPTPFNNRKGAYEAFEQLFYKHRKSILIVSYSSNSIPTKDEMISIMSKFKKNVETIAVDYKYSFGNQNHKVGDNKNTVKEYIFVGY